MRMTGKSTRLIDKYVQKMFKLIAGQSIQIKDHEDSPQANKLLFDNLHRRLTIEHYHALRSGMFRFNKKDLTIHKVYDIHLSWRDKKGLIERIEKKYDGEDSNTRA
jgi:hypothetical protein